MSTDTKELPLRPDMSPLIKRFGNWAVTEYGLERIDRYYPIEAERLWESDWISHVTKKNGVKAEEFIDAYYAAQEIHAYARPRPRPDFRQRLRYRVMCRDSFRCRLCGRSAAIEGVKLQVDHIEPRAAGGSNDISNLWTLCFDCNSGKSNLPLNREDDDL